MFEPIYILVALVAVGGLVLFLRRKPAALPPSSGHDAKPLPEPSTDASKDPGGPRGSESPAAVDPTPEPARPSGPGVAQPVDKPRVPTREERESEALEKKRRERERYVAGLKKTRRGFVAKLGRLVRGKPKVDDDLKDEIEELLFTADIGSSTAEKLFERVAEVLDRKQVADADAVWEVVRASALEILDVPGGTLDYDVVPKPYVLLMIGVNGVGKTTTLGKLAARHVEAGRKVLLVAGDTFRAAATEQLEIWAERTGCDIHKAAPGSDPSSVIFDGIARGRKEGFDVVLCDTAGRLHTKKELMAELDKIRRSASKALSKGLEAEMAPHDTFLVLDATIGQNALSQAKLFKETMDFTGLVLTKLDGTAKGGVVLGVCDELAVPIRYIGIGEGVDDLRRFDAETFVDALLLADAADDDA